LAGLSLTIIISIVIVILYNNSDTKDLMVQLGSACTTFTEAVGTNVYKLGTKVSKWIEELHSGHDYGPTCKIIHPTNLINRMKNDVRQIQTNYVQMMNDATATWSDGLTFYDGTVIVKETDVTGPISALLENLDNPTTYTLVKEDDEFLLNTNCEKDWHNKAMLKWFCVWFLIVPLFCSSIAFCVFICCCMPCKSRAK